MPLHPDSLKRNSLEGIANRFRAKLEIAPHLGFGHFDIAAEKIPGGSEIRD
jgi:hypothetical protein